MLKYNIRFGLLCFNLIYYVCICNLDEDADFVIYYNNLIGNLLYSVEIIIRYCSVNEPRINPLLPIMRFLNRIDTNRDVQEHKMARVWKFWISKQEELLLYE